MTRRTTRHLLAFLLTIGAAFAAAGPARAQETPVVWSAAVTGQRQDTVTFTLSASIAAGWHLYSLTQPPGGPLATRVTAAVPAQILGDLESPTPTLAADKSFGIITETYEHAVTFAGRATTARGPEIVFRVRFQTCDDRVCLPPTTVDVVATPPLIAAALAPPPRENLAIRPRRGSLESRDTPTVVAHVDSLRSAEDTPIRVVPAAPVARAAPLLALGPGVALDGPWAPFLWLAASTGALALLTPCVFPMVPITVAYFTREGVSGGGAMREAFTYALGIVVAFVVLGAAVAALFGAAGINRLAANPWLNVGLGALFVTFALSLIGVVNLRLPNAMVNRVAAASTGGRSPATTMAAALTFTLTSFTCTAPFVGTLLVAAADGGWRRAVAGVAVFATVFSLPFVALAAAPGLVARLPRSGAWMRTLKIVLGVAELCAAVKFFANADQVLGGAHLTRGVVLVLWAMLCAGLAMFLLGSALRARAPGRMLRALVPAALAAWLLLGATGRPLGELESFVPATADAGWMSDDYAGALRAATASGRPVFVDFTGYTCTNCRWMETNMFPQPDVAHALGAFVRLRLYTDGRGPEAARAQAMQRAAFHTLALPLYAVVGGDGRPIATFLGMTRDRAEFVDFLRRAGAP